MAAVVLFRRKWDMAVLLRQLVLLALLAAWLAMAAVEVRQYLSEPTSTSTYWEEDDQLPAFTVCPARTVNSTVSRILNQGTEEQRRTLFGNHTLLEFFWMAGLKTDDMLHNLLPTDVPGEFRDYFGTKWTTSLNYMFGGLCVTATLTHKTSELWSHSFLQQQPDFVLKGAAYTVSLHGNSEFWGNILPLKQTYTLMNETRLAYFIVTTDREVRENLRRAPCEADPTYSRTACERRCFFNGMNCTLEATDNSSKRLCMATDYSYYKAYTFVMKLTSYVRKNCSCPIVCIRDSYTIMTRPGQRMLTNYMELSIQTSGNRKVLHTTISYSGYDLAADLGGFLGLFLGWSLLTLFELLQNGVGCVRGRCKRRPSSLTPVRDIEGGWWRPDQTHIRKLKIVF